MLHRTALPAGIVTGQQRRRNSLQIYGQDAIGWSGCCAHEKGAHLAVRCGSAVRPGSRRLGYTLARPLFLEKIDGALIKVIPSVDDLHLALMSKVLDDLAARRNLQRA